MKASHDSRLLISLSLFTLIACGKSSKMEGPENAPSNASAVAEAGSFVQIPVNVAKDESSGLQLVGLVSSFKIDVVGCVATGNVSTNSGTLSIRTGDFGCIAKLSEVIIDGGQKFTPAPSVVDADFLTPGKKIPYIGNSGGSLLVEVLSRFSSPTKETDIIKFQVGQTTSGTVSASPVSGNIKVIAVEAIGGDAPEFEMTKVVLDAIFDQSTGAGKFSFVLKCLNPQGTQAVPKCGSFKIADLSYALIKDPTAGSAAPVSDAVLQAIPAASFQLFTLGSITNNNIDWATSQVLGPAHYSLNPRLLLVLKSSAPSFITYKFEAK